jgi:acetyl esterase/lipase
MSSRATTDEVETRSGLTYAVHDDIKLLGDLYLPKGAGPFPVLVAVHGGGWVQGARSAFQYWGPYLAARGYALFSVTYRFAKTGQRTFPHAVHDVLAAVQFVRRNAKEHKFDAERVGLVGASAGANLAALAALGSDAPAIRAGMPGTADASINNKVKILIGVYGVYDVLQMWQHYNVQSPRENNIEKFIGVSPLDDRRPYFDASPLSYVTTANNKLAVYLACGTRDDVVNNQAQTDVFQLALKQAGYFVRTCTLEGAPHYWMNDPIDETGSHSGFLGPRLLRFLAEKL